MREIKFRGKRKDNGEWIVGNLFIPNKLVGGIWICPETTYGDFCPGLEEGDDLKDYEFDGIFLGHLYEVIPETVGEYTGLKDKNGKEAYEDDVVRATLIDDKGVRGEFIGKIIFSEFEYCLDTTCNQWPVASWKCVEVFEVIGNVFETPELLQK